MKLSNDKMKAILNPEVVTLSNMFVQNGFEIRIAGGAIRDLLMGLVPTDLDFATTATPQEMKQMFEKEEIRIISKGGENHGTVVVKIGEKIFDCTTLRIDQITDGRHAKVEFTRDWKLDANRRDLTINAMFLGLDGIVYDYFNGIEHLEKRLILFVGDPDHRIKEDYLRILRYFRFFGRVATDPYKHDDRVIDAIKRNAEGLLKVSGERIWIELKKIANGRFGGELLSKIIECNVGPHIGLSSDFDCESVKALHKRLECMSLPTSSVHACTILAAGFAANDDAQVLIKRVKCSNKEKEMLLFPINNKQLFLDSDPLKAIQDALVDMVYKNKAPRTHSLTLFLELTKYVGRVDLLNEINVDLVPHFPVNGLMLKDKVNKNKIQLELNRLVDIWKESNYSLRAEELIEKVNSS